MFLNAISNTLEITFCIQHGDSLYVIFATTDSIRCFECGDLGHKRFTCPHKKQTENDGNNEEHIDRTENTEIPDKEKRPTIVKEMTIRQKQKKQETQGEHTEASDSFCGISETSKPNQV